MEEKAKKLLERLEADLVQLLANVEATTGAIQAVKLLLEPQEEDEEGAG